MGAELDSILIALVDDQRARLEARANALVLLADRQSPHALPVLERALQYDAERLRAGAVQGLSLLAVNSNLAVELIRRATNDRSRTVRLFALQSLDVRDVETVRSVLEREKDPEVRQVALQLAVLAESRGAPLAQDSRGTLRTSAGAVEPQIVFRPVAIDSVTEIARGDLRLELRDRPDIPLSPSATVVSRVVPAFFSPDRSSVVVEDEGRIRVYDVNSGVARDVGQGMAPRPVPFTYQFVFVREKSRDRAPGAIETFVVYDVFQSSFTGAPPTQIGEISALLRSDLHGGESPVRWMVVDEHADGFVLRGENLQLFRLPTPVWGTGRPNGSGNGSYRD
jgi:hypothetical protein